MLVRPSTLRRTEDHRGGVSFLGGGVGLCVGVRGEWPHAGGSVPPARGRAGPAGDVPAPESRRPRRGAAGGTGCCAACGCRRAPGSGGRGPAGDVPTPEGRRLRPRRAARHSSLGRGGAVHRLRRASNVPVSWRGPGVPDRRPGRATSLPYGAGPDDRRVVRLVPVDRLRLRLPLRAGRGGPEPGGAAQSCRISSMTVAPSSLMIRSWLLAAKSTRPGSSSSGMSSSSGGGSSG